MKELDRPPPLTVALRKESVDRNRLSRYLVGIYFGSLSARRAWIEILESKQIDPSVMSLSARRAWIEMYSIREVFANFEGRSPQGERG